MKEIVRGKEVVFRDFIPAKGMWDLTRKVAGIEGIPPWGVMVEQMQLFVESWEFEGDPSDPKTYEAMNYFDLMAVYNRVNEIFAQKLDALKN